MTRFSTHPHRRTPLARSLVIGAAIVLLATACTAALPARRSRPRPCRPRPCPRQSRPRYLRPLRCCTTRTRPATSRSTGATCKRARDAAHQRPPFDSWWAKPSPDGTRTLFYRTPAGVHDTDYKQTSLWMANIDGSGLRQVIANGQYGWAVQGHAEWSPDGTKLVMFGGSVYNGIVVTDTNGVQLHRVGNGIDPVWSSNGKQVIYINCARAADFPSCPADQNRVWAVNEDGSSPHMLVDIPVGANDPTMSPDGSTIAFETNPGGLVWDLWLANADGSNPRKLFWTGTSTRVRSGPPTLSSSSSRPRRSGTGSSSTRSTRTEAP